MWVVLNEKEHLMFNLFYAYVWIISERYIENLVISIWTKVHQIQILKNIKHFQSSRIYVLFIKVKESFKVEDGKKRKNLRRSQINHIQI